MNRSRQLTLAILSVLFLVTLVTGFVGWSTHNLEREGAPNWFDALYRALLAFTGDESYVDDPGLNNWIQVARFTGLMTTISAVIGVAAVFLGEQFKRVRAWWRKGHTVVVGASEFAIDIAERSGKVTVFDTADILDRLPPGGNTLLLSDPMNEKTATTRSLGKGPPQTVIFGAADAITNVERARVWLSNVSPERIKKTSVVLRIEDNSVARDLQLLSSEFTKTKLISRAETVARSLVTSMAPTSLARLRRQARVHVALIGLGSANLAIAEELALRCHHPKLSPLVLTVVDCDPKAAEARLRTERPDLKNPNFGRDGFSINVVGLDALECCAAGRAKELFEAELQVPLTAIVVAAGEDTKNIAIAMRLRQLQLEQIYLRAPIFVRSDTIASVAARPFDDLSGGIVPFGGRMLDAEDIDLDRIYHELAEKVHNIWRDNLAPHEQTRENEWDNLSTSARRSSYRAALSAVEIFYSAGFVPPAGSHLAGLRLEAEAARHVLNDKNLISDLSKTEHTRWNDERRLEGYWFAKEEYRDNEKKIHPLIVPFEKLPEDQPAKDVRNVEEALRLGIERFTGAPKRPCWRKLIRIGVIGPLDVEADALADPIKAVLAQLLEENAAFDTAALEILTPNAPGFDRNAARQLAIAWHAQVGRSARILLLNAARTGLMDRKAAEHLLNEPGDEEVKAFLKRMEDQSNAIFELRDGGHQVRHLDLRPLGVSDAELVADDVSYDQAIRGAQDHLLALADEVIFHTRNGTADWTMRAVEKWKASGGKPIILS